MEKNSFLSQDNATQSTLQKSSDTKEHSSASSPVHVSQDSPDIAELFLLSAEFKHSKL